MSEVSSIRKGTWKVDEDVWLRLVGEPSKQLVEAHQLYLDKDFGKAAIALRSAAVFLQVAKENATDPVGPALAASALEIDQLSYRVTGGCVLHVKVLEAAFARAHHALARHYAVRAGQAVAQDRLTKATNCLCSAVNHVERSAYWCNPGVKTETSDAIKRIVSSLRTGAPDVVRTANAIIEQLETRLADAEHLLPTVPAA